MNEVILVINAGSSSIKFSLFSCHSELNILYHGKIETFSDYAALTIFNANHDRIVTKNISLKNNDSGLKIFFNWLETLSDSMILKAVGHRVVHGGLFFIEPTIVTDDVMLTLTNLTPLAPLHQPHNLEAIKTIKAIYPKLLQVACFDTAFHHTQERLATLFAIPASLTNNGIIRYGFHGLSYEYIISVMSKYIGDIEHKRIIVAHLGNGASMCAIYQGKSVATTMGLTALDGLMMGTRCGKIDSGILLYLLNGKHYTAKQLEHLLYNESGLLGVSGISHDMRELLLSDDARAKEAIELFCYRAALEFGSLAVALQGCDVLVFTAGIGENSAIIRKKICERLIWLGISLNEESNTNNSSIFSENDSSVIVCVIPTNEEYMIAKHTWSIVHVYAN